ncbi:hypothetical protein V8C86DRAFT_2648438 [Haematococcus lacustris]
MNVIGTLTLPQQLLAPCRQPPPPPLAMSRLQPPHPHSRQQPLPPHRPCSRPLLSGPQSPPLCLLPQLSQRGARCQGWVQRPPWAWLRREVRGRLTRLGWAPSWALGVQQQCQTQGRCQGQSRVLHRPSASLHQQLNTNRSCPWLQVRVGSHTSLLRCRVLIQPQQSLSPTHLLAYSQPVPVHPMRPCMGTNPSCMAVIQPHLLSLSQSVQAHLRRLRECLAKPAMRPTSRMQAVAALTLLLGLLPQPSCHSMQEKTRMLTAPNRRQTQLSSQAPWLRATCLHHHLPNLIFSRLSDQA